MRPDVDGPPNAWGASTRTAEESDAELAWCTTGEDDANRYAGPALGLPPLRVVGLRAHEGRPGRKFPAVGRFAAGRPLGRLDDSGLFPTARAEFPARRRETTALVEVDPGVGVTDEDLGRVVAAPGGGR